MKMPTCRVGPCIYYAASSARGLSFCHPGQKIWKLSPDQLWEIIYMHSILHRCETDFTVWAPEVTWSWQCPWDCSVCKWNIFWSLQEHSEGLYKITFITSNLFEFSFKHKYQHISPHLLVIWTQTGPQPKCWETLSQVFHKLFILTDIFNWYFSQILLWVWLLAEYGYFGNNDRLYDLILLTLLHSFHSCFNVQTF